MLLVNAGRRAPSRTRSIAQDEPYDRLTTKELSVLYLLTEAFTDKQIARLLQVTDFTVNYFVTSILSKMGARSRISAAVAAIREQVFDGIGLQDLVSARQLDASNEDLREAS